MWKVRVVSPGEELIVKGCHSRAEIDGISKIESNNKITTNKKNKKFKKKEKDINKGILTRTITETIRLENELNDISIVSNLNIFNWIYF